MKILVVKRDKIGDLLLTTPLFAHLKQSRPDAELHLLATSYNAWVARGNPDIDRLWVYRRVREGGRLDVAAALQALPLRSRLRRERFDWVLVGNGDESERAVRWGLAARGARTVAYVKDAARYPGLSDPLVLTPGVHEMDRLLALLVPMGIPIPKDPPWPRYELPAADAAVAQDWLKSHGLKDGNYVALGLGARRIKKQPIAEQVLRWSTHFKTAWNLDTVFMWTPGKSDDPNYPGDDAAAEPVLAAKPAWLHPFRGPIPQALGLIWSARTSLFPDSGLMHFAAASPGGVLGFFAEADVSPAPSQWAPRGPKADWLEAAKSVAELADELVYERVARLVSR